MKHLILSGVLTTVFLWGACYSSVCIAEKEHDRAAVKATVAKETEVSYKQDFETRKSTYVNEDRRALGDRLPQFPLSAAGGKQYTHEINQGLSK